MIDYDDINTVYDVLRMMNKPFIHDLWQNHGHDFGNYYKIIYNNKQHRDKAYADSIFEPEKKAEVKQNRTSLSDEKSENKAYNRKWKGEYSEDDIEFLEDYLNDLHKDFKVVTVNHKDYAMKIAKASLYMDKCFKDMMAGVANAEKKYKDAKDAFDSLSKSAQFSESQRGQNDVALGCFGKTFEQVEMRTYVKEHIPINPDEIDKMMSDFKTIFRSL